MQQRRRARLTAVAVVLGLVMAACDSGGGASPTTSPTTVPTVGTGGGKVNAAAPRTFGLRLSEGQSLAAAVQAAPVVPGDELTPQRIDEIKSRLPEWTDNTNQHQSFRWPVQSSPPPRTGNTIDEPFPPKDTTPPPTVDNGPLTVLRHQPDGDTPIAPYVAITFNQPMVAVGTVGQVNSSDVPVTITPAVTGHWQWIGTRTLRFDADSTTVDRLPMATTFTVSVPAGTKSAAGGSLADALTWTFTTPPPTVQTFAPDDSDALRLDQLFVATFDQRIDATAVLATIHLKAGDHEVPVRLATAAEIAADDAARQTTEGADDGRWIVFRAADPLPTDTAIKVAIGPDTPSAEGPGVSTAASSHSGHTYAPLHVKTSGCQWGDPCQPGSPLGIQFNNQLDSEADLSGITVSPALAGQYVSVQYDTITITGATVARTDYTVTIPAGLKDVFGQTLAKDAVVTIKIGEAQPSINDLSMITTLDPFAKGQDLSVFSVNHQQLRVRVFAADPARFAEFERYWWNRDNADVTLPAWSVLSDDTITLKDTADGTVETPVDLSGVLQGKPGQVIVLVEPVPAVPPSSNDYYQNRPALSWVQSTQLGVDATMDATNASVWVTDLRTGAPAAGVSLTMLGGDAGSTNGDGVATLHLPTLADNSAAVIATKGDDTAILQLQNFKVDVVDDVRWYVIDDRQIYRPGETMHVKGWVRRANLSSDGSLAAIASGTAVHYTINDSYGNEVAKGDTTLGALGGFDLTVVVPETANVGPATLNLTLAANDGLLDTSTNHSFRIEEYRRPEFEVTTRPESQGPYVSTSPATVAATGAYYAGGPLPQAPVDWSVTTTPTTYAPPGWDGFTFGIWTPWWISDSRGGFGDFYVADGPCCGPNVNPDATTATYHGTTDSNGTHYLQLGFEGKDGTLPDLPVAVSAQATITDVNRQAWSSTTDLIVHAADRYVGLRTTRTFVRQGDPLGVEAIVTGIDGKVLPGVTLDLVAGRVESRMVKGSWTEVVVDPQTCTVTSGQDPASCTFDTAIGGQYKVTAVVTDEHGGHNRTELTTWVSGAQSAPSRGVTQQQLTVVPDKATYAAGDTAQLLVQAPFATGEGLITIAHNGIRSTVRFTLAGGSAVVELPITEADVPELALDLEVVGAAARTADDGSALPDAPQQPVYAVGTMTLSVPPVSRTLTVKATPRDTELVPGGSTTIDVKVDDAAGKPVQGAEFAVVVVDEAVLALSDYQLTDPLSVFYAAGNNYLSTAYSHDQIQLANPLTVSGGGGDSGGTTAPPAPDTTASSSSNDFTSSVAGGQRESADGLKAMPGASGSGTTPIDVRSNFDALALFQPSVTTDADGTAHIDVTVPDNLTRYRVMVVAVSGTDRFGSTESNITARLPLSVRPSAPRFANFGDSFELPVVVQNQGDTAMDVDVLLQTSNLTSTGPVGKKVSVPAHDRVEVRFPVTTVDAGTAGFRVTAISGDMADSATVTIPVYTPATAEAFATYGVIDNGALDQPVLAPTDVIPGFGGLSITTSSTSLQALTDAVLYLVQNPYDSADARASRIIAIAALADVLDAFQADGVPSKDALDASVKADIAALAALQNGDGGFPWFRQGDDDEPFISVEVAHSLVLAKARGYAVPDVTLSAALQYLADIEAHIPSEYGQQQRDMISAYALWVRDLAGQGDAAKAIALYRSHPQDLTVDALAWLWTATHDTSIGSEIERTLNNRVVETAGAANFTTDYGDSAYLVMHSDRRTDGIVLDALIANAPDSDLIPKVVTGLLANKVKGRWDNMQENSFILLALRSYFDTFEAQTPDFVAKVWLGQQFAGDHTFQGRQTDRSNITIPTADVIAAGNSDLVLSKDGNGRLYYRIGLTYAPADLHLDALDRGFVVDRVYEAVDDPADVTRDADGTWHIKAGARVRVKLTMVAESQRTHVALIDPLPAGLESLNPSLAVTQTAPPSTDGDGASPITDELMWSWWGQWYQHEQLRDDRTEAFTTFLPAGTYTYSYVARATTPGTFVVPPTRAEEMYSPETFGRTATDKVVIS